MKNTGTRISVGALLAGYLMNLLVPTPSLGATDADPDATQLAERYSRAAAFLPWNASRMVKNADVAPHWIGAQDAFWYARQNETGPEFIFVEAANGRRHTAFDAAKVAEQLSVAAKEAVDLEHLVIKDVHFDAHLRVVDVLASVKGAEFLCRLSEGRCAPAMNTAALTSPDGKWIAFLKGNDLWVRSTQDGSEHALSNDGEPHHGYGVVAGTGAGGSLRADGQQVPIAVWSPDSKRIVTERLDEREVLTMNLIEYAPPGEVRPRLHSTRYAYPGDTHKPSAELVIFEVASGKRVRVDHEPAPATYVGPISDDRVWWSQDGASLYAIPREESQRHEQLLLIDAQTGATRVLIEESGKTYVEIGGGAFDRAVKTLADGRIIWYSERDNWGHLYLYDRQGGLIRQLTSGHWKVMRIARIDERRQRLYFVAVGREPDEDPYQRHLYAVNLDGSRLVDITPENGDHEIRIQTPDFLRVLRPGLPGPSEASLSPSGRYVVDTYSRPDAAPVSTLRTSEGKLITKLEVADATALMNSGLRLPEPFHVVAADGKTTLYGTIYRPDSLDASKKYPIIDVIYPGPQSTVTQKSFMGAIFGGYETPQGLAELGFIVVNVDGRGTPYRSKEFHNVSYGDMGQAGNLEDHMAGLRQLAARYPYMDLSRVAITGSSGGGFAAARAILMYPDFYKVALSVSGNHDLRGYLLAWGPTYEGPFDAADYDRFSNAKLAANLKGKLFLAHGDVDDNVPPSLTMQLVDALIKANKSFDLLLVPGKDHSLAMVSGSLYLQRRKWDYLVKNLLGVEPPEFVIPGP